MNCEMNPKAIILKKKSRSLKGTVRLPHSKSISNRLLILRELADGPFEISNLSEAEDTVLLESLIAAINRKKGGQTLVELDCANAGTVMRFLTAWLSLVPGKWVMTGSERMKQRPIGTLVDGLNFLGAEIDYLSQLGYPPVLIKGKALTGKMIVIDPGISSQFVSALLMIAPRIPGGLSIRMSGSAVSVPYVNMTIRLLEFFSVRVEQSKTSIQVYEGPVIPKDYTVEADWSAAASWYEMVALSEKADLLLAGLKKESLQGDAVLAELYRHFGVETEFVEEGARLTKVKKDILPFHFNFSDHPDIAQPVITTCALLGCGGRFEGLSSLRIKETDRLKALSDELAKIGFGTEIVTDNPKSTGMILHEGQGKITSGMVIPVYGDHRMAMSFAPLAMKFGEIGIADPDVVRKSYPGYWEDLASNGFEIS